MESYRLIEHLSYSQLKLYQECPFKYKLKYIDKVQQSAQAIPLVTGKNFHSGMQEMYDYKSFDKGKTLFRESMRKYGKESETIIDNLTRAMHLYSEMHLDNYFSRVVGTEIKIDLFIPGVDVPIIGYIDLELTDGIIDHKTFSGTDSSDAFDPKQLVLYSIWFFRKYKMLPRTLEAHIFNKLSSKVEIISLNVDFEMIAMVMAEFVQLWADIKSERWTPNMNAWDKKDEFYDLACEYAESLVK